mgnify:CR=1 FL=1
MDKVSGKLTVFFEEPFWVGVFECVSDGKLSVCKVTFGAEPKASTMCKLLLRKILSYLPHNAGIYLTFKSFAIHKEILMDFIRTDGKNKDFIENCRLLDIDLTQ